MQLLQERGLICIFFMPGHLFFCHPFVPQSRFNPDWEDDFEDFEVEVETRDAAAHMNVEDRDDPREHGGS